MHSLWSLDHTGKYWASLRSIRTATTTGQYSPIRSLAQLKENIIHNTTEIASTTTASCTSIPVPSGLLLSPSIRFFFFFFFVASTAIALLLSRHRIIGSNHYQVITCNPNLYLGCWLQFVYRGSPNRGVDFKYLKKARSKISPDDVYWSFDEKEGWSACSKTCAGGMAVEHYRNFFSVYFITLIIYNNYH